MAKKKNTKVKNFSETYLSERKDWGNIKPVTKIIPNKKKNYQFKEEDY